jgi:hypothetical protein
MRCGNRTELTKEADCGRDRVAHLSDAGQYGRMKIAAGLPGHFLHCSEMPWISSYAVVRARIAPKDTCFDATVGS